MVPLSTRTSECGMPAVCSTTSVSIALGNAMSVLALRCLLRGSSDISGATYRVRGHSSCRTISQFNSDLESLSSRDSKRRYHGTNPRQ